jgi:hypothetical protein
MYEGQAENLLTNEEKIRNQKVKMDYLRDYIYLNCEQYQPYSPEEIYVLLKEIWDVAYSYGFDDGFEKCLKVAKNDR